MLKIFVSGLEKQTGKTIVTAGLAATMQSLNYSTSVFKPIQTGAVSLNGFLQSQDMALIKRIDTNIKTTVSYAFTSDDCPLIAAYEVDKGKINPNNICNDYKTNTKSTECHIVEGSNSISTPICEKMTEADLVKTLKLPLVMVVNPKKSSIDNVISGINFVYSSHINFLGVIIDDYDGELDNTHERFYPELIKEYTDADILGTIPHYKNVEILTPETLIEDVLNRVEIEKIFGLKIAKLSQ